MSSVAARLGAFALVLTGTFATAYAVGENAPGHSHSSGSHAHAPSGPIDSSEYELMAHPMGDSVSFHLISPEGSVVDQFELDHTVRLHAIVVRPDLSGFEHIHPDVDDAGEWTVPVPGPGPWRLVFELRPADADGSVVMTYDLDDGTTVDEAPLPSADDEVAVDTASGPLTVRRDGLTFSISDGGAVPDGLEPYLGADAHLVALRAGDLAFAHLHPSGATDDAGARAISFGGTLEAGEYRLFLQFGYRGEVVTVPFTVSVDEELTS